MKKIIFYFCFFLLFGCSGFEPLFSSKNISYYIADIESVDKNDVTKRISKRLGNIKKDNTKKGYSLKVSANMKKIISSKDNKGQVSAYRMIVSANFDVRNNDSNILIGNIKLDKDFIYDNQKNKFELKKYEKIIQENLIDKILQEINIRLHTL
jgi:outer membrane lipopolysaccharide assembly protein LptE/RlpB|tara:strand:+ start:2458 stop:2916 length:459 start_codon:yes stop_codon:yes gene_type:complete